MAKKYMTSSEIDDARNALTDKIVKLTGCADDGLLDLLENLYQLSRADTLGDVVADLNSEGEAEAVEIIEANYII